VNVEGLPGGFPFLTLSAFKKKLADDLFILGELGKKSR
jgi:hypothetical protein